MIEVDEVGLGYDDIQVVWDASLEIREDDNVVALLGSNGAGKSTVLKAMSGLLPVMSGDIRIDGNSIDGKKPEDIVEEGFVQVPEELNLFSGMTIKDNLEMGAFPKRARDQREEALEEVYEVFPVLEEKEDGLARDLSGGQQQMLAIGRGLMAQPRVLALDEPSSGLAPQITKRVFDTIEEISSEITVLLIEQHVDHALQLADRAYLMESGNITTEGTGSELLESDHVKEAYLQG